MKTKGGYLPSIAGRPSGDLEDLRVPGELRISLERHGDKYSPVVSAGQEVKAGDPLAELTSDGVTLNLASPAAGRVLETGSDDYHIVLETRETSSPSPVSQKFEPQRTDENVLRDVLAKGGIWPYFWSSRADARPSLSGEGSPRAIIVNSVFAEPFRARGKVALQHSWNLIVRGIRFLPRLLSDYGSVEFVLTSRKDPVVRMLSVDTSGYAWIHYRDVPLRYPIENPQVLSRAIRGADSAINKDDDLWVIDVQGVEAIGSLLAEGVPLSRRMVAVGGPGASRPRHVKVMIGTPLSALLEEEECRRSLVLRGGLINGVPVDPDKAAVQADDDAFFLLPIDAKREFLAFVQPGFAKTSILSCYASRLTGARDSQISHSLRGERRPCIACGLCEKVCPVGLMPQVLHRYLYAGQLDDAESAGLNLCVDCRLCTYVCPSKIEIREELSSAREQLKLEKEESESEAEV